MDRLSLIGLFLALASLVGGSILKGAGLSSLWSPAAFVIVIVGTIAAILLHTSPAWRRSVDRALGRRAASDRRELIQQIVEWSNIARRQGLLGLEPQVEQHDPFLRKGLQLLVDGVEPESSATCWKSNSTAGNTRHRPLPRCSKRWASMRRRWASSARCSA
jgi:chemotaxis protein MotA